MSVEEVCTNGGVLTAIAIVMTVLKYAFIIGPMISIVMISIDFAKNVISGDDEFIRKNLKVTIKRILTSVVIAFVPFFTSMLVGALGNLGVDYTLCIENSKHYSDFIKEDTGGEYAPGTDLPSINATSKDKTTTSKGTYTVTKIVLNRTRATIGDSANVVSMGKTYANNYVKLEVTSISPASAKNKKVKWEVIEGADNVKVNQKGEVRGRNGGSAVVRATSVDNPNVYADCQINIVHHLQENVKINQKVTVTGKYNNKKYTLKKNTKVVLLGALKSKRRNYSNLNFRIRLKDGTVATIQGKYLTFYNYHIDSGYKNSDYEDYVNNNGFTSKTNYLIWVNAGTQRLLLFQKSGKKWKLKENFKTSTGDDEGKNTHDKGGSAGIKFNLEASVWDSGALRVKYETTGSDYANPMHTGALPKNEENPSENDPSSHGCTHLSTSFRNKMYNTYNGGSQNRLIGSKVIFY